MISGSFLERLEAAAKGKVSRESVLEPFLDGLETLWSDFEASLEQQPDELATFLEAYVAAIEDALNACAELAQECLGPEAGEEAFLDLGDAHTHANRLLLDFHSQSWVFRGPTKVDWINMVVDGGERFLAGENFPRHLISVLDDHVRELEFKLSCRPALEGEALLKVTRLLAAWARGTESMSRHQFEDLLTKIIGYAERFSDYLTEQTASLEQLLASLGGDVPKDEIVWLLDGVLTELKRIRAQFESALKSSVGTAGSEADQLLATLDDLDAAISSLAEQGDGRLSEEDIDDLHELHEMLEEEIGALSRAATREGTVACPSCGHRNARRSARCGACSFVLPADLSDAGSTLELSEDQQLEGGEENVIRFRRALRGFQNLSVDLDTFHSVVQSTRLLLEEAISSFPSGLTVDPSFKRAGDLIARCLRQCLAVEEPDDPRLEEALGHFEEGVGGLKLLLK